MGWIERLCAELFSEANLTERDKLRPLANYGRINGRRRAPDGSRSCLPAPGRKPGARFPFVELFSLKGFSANIYDVTGKGPAYDYTGAFLVSRQRYAAFYQTRGQVGSNLVITAYAGRFNPTTRSGLLKGTDGVTTNMKLDITPVP